MAENGAFDSLVVLYTLLVELGTYYKYMTQMNLDNFKIVPDKRVSLSTNNASKRNTLGGCD